MAWVTVVDATGIAKLAPSFQLPLSASNRVAAIVRVANGLDEERIRHLDLDLDHPRFARSPTRTRSKSKSRTRSRLGW